MFGFGPVWHQMDENCIKKLEKLSDKKFDKVWAKMNKINTECIVKVLGHDDFDNYTVEWGLGDKNNWFYIQDIPFFGRRAAKKILKEYCKCCEELIRSL